MAAPSGRAEIHALLSIFTRAVEDAMNEYDRALVPIPSLRTVTLEHASRDFGSLPLRKAIRTLEGACEQLRSTLAPPSHVMINRSMNFDSNAIKIVAESKVADVLLHQPQGLHVEEIAKRVGLSAERLCRVLRMLATKHCFIEVSENVFANNRLSLTLVSTAGEASIAEFLATESLQAAAYLSDIWKEPGWSDSYDSRRSAFAWHFKDELHKEGTMFDWFKLHPERGQLFNNAMIGFSNASGALISIEAYPWGQLPKGSTVCDVGSGIGAFTLPLAKAHPHLSITLQDLPGPMDHARKLWQEEMPSVNCEGNISFVSLDFMKESPIAGQDIYYLRFVMHMWSDTEALTLLKNVKKAMAAHSRVLIHDYLLKPACSISESNECFGIDTSPAPLLSNFGAGSSRGYAQDFNVMTLLNGKERTITEMRLLGDMAGLEIVKIWDLAELDMIEFRIADISSNVQRE